MDATVKTAVFKFDRDLATLLPQGWTGGTGSYSFSGPQSIKHLIEALGVPHTEIGALVVDGKSAGLDYLVRDGDSVDVSCAGDTMIPAEPSFVIDGHLGRLNAGLRMLGFDCSYRTDMADSELAETAVRENRILLTRDRRLLMRKIVTAGFLIRSPNPPDQLREVVRRFGLIPWIRPFRRCIRCNTLLIHVKKQAVNDRLEPLTRLYFEEFSACPGCQQIYWRGSHVEKMERTISGLRLPDQKS